jgi:hypothetical protein
MVISVIAASLAVAIVTAWAVLVWRARLESRRRLEVVVGELDRCLGGIAVTLARALDRSEDEREIRRADLGLTLDLDELLVRLAQEAAARTGAQAAVARIRGPTDDPAVGSFGTLDTAQLLDSTLRPPDRRPFRALTINWTYPAALDAEADSFRSALVVPVVEDGLETGIIAGFAREAAAFRPEHARALETLAAEAAEGIATARRFTALRLRATTGRREDGGRASGSDRSGRDEGPQNAKKPHDARR